MYSYIIAKTHENVNCAVKSQSNGCSYIAVLIWITNLLVICTFVATNNQDTSFVCVLFQCLFVCYRLL